MDILKQPNTVFHCPTKKLAIQFCNLLHEKGYKWASDESYKKVNYYNYKARTCYCPLQGSYCHIEYWKEYSYNIIKVTPSFFTPILKLKTFLL